MSSPIRQHVATNIKRALDRSGMKTRELIEAAGVSSSQYFDVMNCDKSTTIDWLARIAEPLKMTVWELVKPPRGRRKS